VHGARQHAVTLEPAQEEMAGNREDAVKNEMLDWNDFRFFLAVARGGTISSAAKALGVDNATVGRRIASLETALGTQPFDRSPQGYKLSTLGEALLPSAERVEVSVMGAKAWVDDLQNSTTGSLRIGATDAFGGSTSI